MPSGIRNLSLALLAGSTLVLAGALAPSTGMIGSQPAFAQGNGGGHGNGGGGGGNSSSHSSGGGSNASTNSGSHGQSGNAPGHANANSSIAYAGSQSTGGTPHAIIRQYVLATGLSQGEVASTLKSWNSLNRNPRAFAATLNNPNSLPALQVAYIRDNMLAAQQLAAFQALGGSASSPPTAQQYQDAQAYIAAEQTLGGQDPNTVVNAPPGTYTQAEVDAATTVLASSYTSVADAQTVVDQYNAWTAYQTAEATATDAFKAASVSYRNADQTTLDALRNLVDDIIKTEGLDTMVSSL